MSSNNQEEQFAELFSIHQQRLFGYILGLVRNTADAQDILQQTAVTLWKKFGDFDPDTDFVRWGITVARFQTLNFLKYRRRSRAYFNQELMEQLGEEFGTKSDEVLEARRDALADCLSKLPGPDRKLIECRYSLGLGSRPISGMLERSQASICNSLRRIRESLLRCIESKTDEEAGL
jgi:RNA polymerase sigma-70 factor (ECF subfamily)